MLKVYLVIVVTAMVAAPYLEFAGRMDDVESAMESVAAVARSLSASEALGPLNGTSAAALWPAQALLLCSVAGTAGPTARDRPLLPTLLGAISPTAAWHAQPW